MLEFIVNPNAGGESGYKEWKEVERRLLKLGIEYRVRLTTGPKDAITYARMLTEGITEPMTLVAMGGDGTLNEVVTGAVLSDKLTLGYIPNGSGNDFARSLGIPTNSLKALDIILRREEIRELDCGEITYKAGDSIQTRRFVVSAGIGYDAKVVHRINKGSIKRRLSKLGIQKIGYGIIGVTEIAMSKTSRATLTMDSGETLTFKDMFFISAHIVPYEGGGFKFAPEADSSDGKLTLCVMDVPKRLNAVPALAMALKGEHTKFAGVSTYDVEKVTIHSDNALYTHVDGEGLNLQHDIELRCSKGAIRLIV